MLTMKIPVKISNSPRSIAGDIFSLNKKYPTIVVSVKFIPLATGITKENFAPSSALNNTRADTKIRAKPEITLTVKRKVKKPEIPFSLCTPVLNSLFIKAAPETLSVAYKKLRKTVTNKFILYLGLLFHQR